MEGQRWKVKGQRIKDKGERKKGDVLGLRIEVGGDKRKGRRDTPVEELRQGRI